MMPLEAPFVALAQAASMPPVEDGGSTSRLTGLISMALPDLLCYSRHLPGCPVFH
jgi:hypothetical protein